MIKSDAVMNVLCTNTILYCRRWTETVHFYRKTLGLPVSFENNWFVEFQVSGGSFMSIADVARATVKAGQGRGVTLSWQVDDVHAARVHLLEKGVAVGPVRVIWKAYACYLNDPEGHRIELWSQ